MSWFERVFGLQSQRGGHRNVYDIPEEARMELRRQKRLEEKSAADKLLGAFPVPDAPEIPRLGLRVEPASHDGLFQGVPPLLEALRAGGARATFYLNLGPDRAGLYFVRLLRNPRHLLRLRRFGLLRGYSWRTRLSGLLVPPRVVGAEAAPLARRIVEEGHEVGVQPWDRHAWQTGLQRMSADLIDLQMERAAEAYEQIFGREPQTMASPGIVCSNESLRHGEKLGLRFASDSHGTDPYLPNIEAHSLRVPQVPNTVPALQDALGISAPDAASFYEAVLAETGGGRWPVLTVYPEVEGLVFLEAFKAFLGASARKGVKVVPLSELLAARLALEGELPSCTISYGLLDGHLGLCSIQMLQV